MKTRVFENYLTSAEVAELLGYHVEHVRSMARAGKLGALQFGRQWVFPKGEVVKYKRIVEEYGKNNPQLPELTH